MSALRYAGPMERVQVRLRPEEADALRCESRRLRISMSEVVRRALQPLVEGGDGSPAWLSSSDELAEIDERDPLFRIEGIADKDFKGDPTHASTSIDEVVYGIAMRHEPHRT